ncbi:FecR family protein [Pseudomonas sp.]|uniref:FecR family protein n=1 Tax=Pseudomonas sp. TaxID=306 RepID=UPI0026054D9D|nr:FecR family protein [Pseudomonas sp.]
MPTPRSIDEQAAEWMLRLHEEGFSEAVRLEFEHWKQQTPQHAAAAIRMQEAIGRLQALRGQAAPAKAALNAAFSTRKSPRHKQALRALAIACAVALPSALFLQSHYPQYLMADISTGPNDWKTLRLADDSSITLSGTSAVNVHFDDQQRRIELLQGEVLVDVAHDSARPFVVQTEQGSMRALGTRFVVKREQDVTVLSMLQSRVAAQSADEQHTLEVDAGSRAMITQNTVERAGTVDPAGVNEAWKHHQLVVDNQPLPHVLDEISRHRRGYIQFDPAALAHLQVSAVLPLDDTDRALQLIAETLPLNIKRFTPWLIVISTAPPAEK